MTDFNLPSGSENPHIWQIIISLIAIYLLHKSAIVMDISKVHLFFKEGAIAAFCFFLWYGIFKGVGGLHDTHKLNKNRLQILIFYIILK